MESIGKAAKSLYYTFEMCKDGAASVHQYFAMSRDNPLYQASLQGANSVYNLFCYIRQPAILRDKTVAWWNSTDTSKIESLKTQRLASLFFFLQILKTVTYLPVHSIPFPILMLTRKDYLNVFANICGISGSGLMVSAELPALNQLQVITTIRITEKLSRLFSYTLSAQALAIQIFTHYIQFTVAPVLLLTGQMMGITSVILISISYSAWAYDNKELILSQLKQTVKKTSDILNYKISELTRFK